MGKRRKFLTTIAGVTAVTVWQKPVIKFVALPAHAQTTTPEPSIKLLCSMQLESGGAFPEGGSTTSNVIINLTTNPPAPGAPITWVGQCGGVDDFSEQNDTLDGSGEYLLFVQSSLLCSGGPPDSGTELTHVFTLDDSGVSTSCSFIFEEA